MKLVKAKKGAFRKYTKHTDLLKLLEDFVAMDCECAEVVGAMEHYSNTNSAQTTLQAAIVRYNFKGIIARTASGRVFLAKTDT